MLGTLTSGAQVSKKRKDEIIETSLSVIHQLSMRDDPTTHPDSIELFKSTTLELIGQAMLRGEDITEDEAKQGLQYLDDSRKISKAFGAVGKQMQQKYSSRTSGISAFRSLGLKRHLVNQKQMNKFSKGIEMPIR